MDDMQQRPYWTHKYYALLKKKERKKKRKKNCPGDLAAGISTSLF
jgi:hypothetical protein